MCGGVIQLVLLDRGEYDGEKGDSSSIFSLSLSFSSSGELSMANQFLKPAGQTVSWSSRSVATDRAIVEIWSQSR